MIENTKKYQIILTLIPTLEPEKLEQMINKVKESIINKEGSLSEILGNTNQSAQLKKLSYPIKRYEEAFYLTLNFSLPPENVTVLNQELNMEDNIIRHIITTQDEIKIQPKEKIDYSKMIEKIEPLPTPEISKKPIKTSTKKATKSEIEDLDKKLEEILSE